jgi:hypothetical protein
MTPVKTKFEVFLEGSHVPCGNGVGEATIYPTSELSGTTPAYKRGTEELLLDPTVIKSDDIILSQVKCSEPCAPISKVSPIEFKGSLVVTCCPCPECICEKCDKKEYECEKKKCECENCECEKKKCECENCQCENCQCELESGVKVGAFGQISDVRRQELFDKKECKCGDKKSYLEKLFPCFYSVNVPVAESTLQP